MIIVIADWLAASSHDTLLSLFMAPSTASGDVQRRHRTTKRWSRLALMTMGTGTGTGMGNGDGDDSSLRFRSALRKKLVRHSWSLRSLELFWKWQMQTAECRCTSRSRSLFQRTKPPIEYRWIPMATQAQFPHGVPRRFTLLHPACLLASSSTA